jgi:hypothetical protein
VNEAETIPNKPRCNLLLRWFIFAVLHRLVAVGCFWLAFLEGMASFTQLSSHFWASLFCYIDFPVVLLMRYGVKRPLFDTPSDPSSYWTFTHHTPLDGAALLWSIVIGFVLAALSVRVSRWFHAQLYPPTPTRNPNERSA